MWHCPAAHPAPTSHRAVAPPEHCQVPHLIYHPPTHPCRYVEKMKKPIKDGFEKAAGGSAGKKGQPAVPASPVAHAHIHVVDRFGGWKARALQVLAGLYDASLPDCFPAKPNETVLSAVAGEPELTALPPKQLRPTVFPFVAYKTKQAKEGGKEVLSVKLPFDEAQVLEASTGYILRCGAGCA